MNIKKQLLEQLHIEENELIGYGEDKFKVSSKLISRIQTNPKGKLILVTSINPTSAGEGKTTMSIGLAQGFKKLGKSVSLALREPSMGPVFGQKGGGTGGGLCQIEPSLDINLHFTGDIHALTSAHNLLSALIDQHIYFGNELNIETVTWPRALDVNDRSLRHVQTETRTDAFVITSASEMMAILALSKDFKDLRRRIGQIVIGLDAKQTYIKVGDLGCTDALLTILKDAIKPNLVLSTEGVPAFVHAGPFANIAHGCNSVIATDTALKLSDYVITEAGFGADLGMEKFLHIKKPHLNHDVAAVVIVATIKALKLHGGESEENLAASNPKAVEKHYENVLTFGLTPVVTLNINDTDSYEEKAVITKWVNDRHIYFAEADGFKKGGEGMIDLVKVVLEAIKMPHKFKPLYENAQQPSEKIDAIAKTLYGANDVHYSKKALAKLALYKDVAFPICMAKTPMSFTHDPKIKGRPLPFTLEVSDITLSFGAELLVVLTKGIYTMPGLNKNPRANEFKIDDEGVVIHS